MRKRRLFVPVLARLKLSASLTLAAGLVIAACSGGATNLDIQKYDRTCKNLNDCLLVATDACCGCPNEAVNLSAEAQYSADFAAARKNCGQKACPAIGCVQVAVGCSAGLCVTLPVTVEAGADAAADSATDSAADSGSDSASDAASDAASDSAAD